MNTGRHRFGLVLLLTAMSVLLIVQPATARTVETKTGSTGQWFLDDSAGSTGAHCDYVYKSNAGEYGLNRMTVHAPYVYARQGTQLVGWQFTVQRQSVDQGHSSSWENRYTSKIFKGYATTSSEANFVAKGVKVIVPFSEIVYYRYRALIKLLWYLPNGNVAGTARARVGWYTEYADINRVKHGSCDSYE